MLNESHPLCYICLKRLYAHCITLVCWTGDNLYDSATKLRLPDFPAFALECLPNRNSLLYGDLYGIGTEASTVFRGTLRYEGMVYICSYYFQSNFCH